MDLKTFISPLTQEQREEFAAKCETTKGHLQNVMYGMKSCATDLAVLIERNSLMVVRRWDLRPDDWFKHWPELIGTEGAPDVPVVLIPFESGHSISATLRNASRLGAHEAAATQKQGV